MAVDSDNILVGAAGTVRVAPVGTAVPTGLASYSGTWVDLGYLGEDGVSFDPTMDVNEIMAWQDFYPVRRNVTSRGLDITLPLLEWKKDTIPFAFGGGEVTTDTGIHTYTPPDPEDIDERALSIEWSDGTRDYRWHIARVMVSSLPSFSVQRTDPATLEITCSVMGVSGATPWHFITDDAAFA